MPDAPHPAARRALVLSGGGAKGAFQAGALEVLVCEAGLDLHDLCGVSVGALGAAFLACAPLDADPATSLATLQARVRALVRLWTEEIQGSGDIRRRRILGMLGIPLGADSLHDTTPLADLLRRHVDPACIARSGRRLRIAHVSLETGAKVVATESDPFLRERVLASASLPFLFPPVRLGTEHHVDGGVRDITPIGLVFDLPEPAPTEIVVIQTSPHGMDPITLEDGPLGLRRNAFHILARTVAILLDEVEDADVRETRRLNDLVSAWEGVRDQASPDVRAVMDEAFGGLSATPLTVIRPQAAIPGGLDFDPAALRAACERGRLAARATLEGA